MTPERWTRVKDVLSLALKQPAQQRNAVVLDACSGDEELRAEIHELLASEEAMGGFLAEPLFSDRGASSVDTSLRDLKAWTRYEVLECIGQGGMAAVYKARDPRLNRLTAIKLIDAGDQVTVQRFLREAEAQAGINHDNVLQVYETGVIDADAGVGTARHFIAMQYVDGPTLLGVREETTLDRKVELMLAIAEGLHAAHRQGLVHRDIKPSNILVERSHDRLKPYLLDFGLAVELGSPGITKTGLVLGTPRYMPPERIRGGTLALDRRSDIYSLGATYYEFITGTPPFAGGNGLEVLAEILKGDFPPLRKHVPTVPSELEAIVTKCLEPDPQNRYLSARALAEDLRRHLDGDPVLARPAGVVMRVAKRARKYPRLTTAFALLALLAMAAAGWGVYSYWRSTRQAELAQQLGQEIRDLDWLFRAAQMSPVHDITPQKHQVQQGMARLERMMRDVGSPATGPVNYARGRGLLTLGDYAKALEHLERAWSEDYRTADAAMALGIAHGEAFRVETDRARRIGNATVRAARIRELETVHRDRALHYLQEGRSSIIVPAIFAEALMASHRGERDHAIALATQAARETPWLFEAILLSGHLQFQHAYQTYLRGDVEAGYSLVTIAENYYAQAARIAPSSVDAHIGRCSTAGMVLHMVMHRAPRDPAAAYALAEETCARAVAVDPQQPEAHRLFSDALRFWAGIHVNARREPGDAYDRATEFALQAVRLSNGSRDAFLSLADTHLDRAWWQSRNNVDPRQTLDQAIAILEKLVATYRSDDAANSVAQAYVLRGRYETSRGINASASLDRAVANFQLALKLEPTIALHFSGLAKTVVARADEHLRHNIDPSGPLKDVLNFLDQFDPAHPARAKAVADIQARLRRPGVIQ